jgi:RNA polymerase sigma factor (sigma-70 family)
VERLAVPAGRRTALRRPKRLLALRSDERLVEHVRAGDEAAFEVLYERYAAGVLGFCRHMLGSRDEAEDAVQQAFVSAHSDMLRGAREINFKPWLYTIARNRCLSMLRARREQAVELPELSTAGLSESVERRSDLRELVGDVQRLPDDQREALVLSELGDLSHAEIADVVGCEPVAVKGLVFRARSALMERREARQAECGDIRQELAVATGGGLRKSRLRYHLEACPGCCAYLEEVRRQRRLLGVALPVVPTLALHESVMASVGIGGTGAAGGGLAAGGAISGSAVGGGAVATTAPLLGGTLAKVAVVGALAVGGAGVTTEVIRHNDRADAPAGDVRQSGDGAQGRGDRSSSATGADTPAAERNKGRRGAERRDRGQRRAAERSDGKSAAGEAGRTPPGRAKAPDGAGDPATGRRPDAVPRVAPTAPTRGSPPTPVPSPPPASQAPPPKPQGGGGTPPSPPIDSPPAYDEALPPPAQDRPAAPPAR